MPPEGVLLTGEGNRTLPNAGQDWLWQNWEAFWREVARTRAAERASLYCLFGGDATDGDHHGTPQIVSKNLEPQSYVVDRTFGIPLALDPTGIIVIRGTGVHVGPEGSSEEALARVWGTTGHRVITNKNTGAWSHWHWRGRLNGRLFDVQHHGKIGGKNWTETGFLANLARDYTLECLDAGEEIPDVVVRSHRHRSGDSGNHSRPRWIATPAWQLKTEHAHKVVPDRIADVGGVIILIREDGSMRIRTARWRPSLPPIWSPV